MKITTDRLVLRPLCMQDAPAIQKYFPHWDIVRQLSAKAIKWPYPPDGAEKFLRNIALPAMARGEDWYFGITRKDDPAGEVIGAVHLRRDTASGNRGIWLASDFQGRGYMQEAVTALNDYAFDVLGFDRLVIKNAAENTASRKLKQKTAARHIATVPASHYLDGCPAQDIWELTASEWRGFRALAAGLCRPRAAPSPLWSRVRICDAFAKALRAPARHALRCVPRPVPVLRPA
ncbi:MAG: GNAT family N-acetyltransferase [Alphaproteobacteria bacterium]